MGVLSRVLATIGQFARRRASLRCTTCGLACGNDERRGAEFFVTHLRPSFSIVCRTPAPVVGGYVYTLGKASWLCDLLSQPMAAGCYSPLAVIIITFLSSSAKSPKFRLPPVPLFLCSSTSIASFRAVQARGRLGGRNLVKIWAGIITWPAGACEPPQGLNPSL